MRDRQVRALRDQIFAQSEVCLVLPQSKNAKPAEPECKDCRWARVDRSVLRCHANPPQVRLPFDNIAAWPVVPAKGGGCRLHEWKEAV